MSVRNVKRSACCCLKGTRAVHSKTICSSWLIAPLLAVCCMPNKSCYIGIPTSTSPALDIVALCLSSWPAAIFTQAVTSYTPAAASQSAISFLKAIVRKSRLAHHMSLHDGLTGLRINHFADTYILPWFQTSYQASLGFCL